eukprot:3627642-Amphidinium_carterae.1
MEVSDCYVLNIVHLVSVVFALNSSAPWNNDVANWDVLAAVSGRICRLTLLAIQQRLPSRANSVAASSHTTQPRRAVKDCTHTHTWGRMLLTWYNLNW